MSSTSRNQPFRDELKPPQLLRRGSLFVVEEIRFQRERRNSFLSNISPRSPSSIKTVGSSGSPIRKLGRRQTIAAIKQQFDLPEHSNTDDTIDDLEDDHSEISMFPFKIPKIDPPFEAGLEIMEQYHSSKPVNISGIDSRLQRYMMTFMQLDDLVRYSMTCRRVYNESDQCDEVWSKELLRNGFYKIVFEAHLSDDEDSTDQPETVRGRFLKFVRDKEARSKLKKIVVKKFQYVHRWQAILQIIYGLIAPSLLAFGLTLSAIFLPLYFDQYIENTRRKLLYCSLPFLTLSLPGLVVLLVGALIDPLVFNMLKQQYYLQMVEDGFTGPGETGHQFDFVQLESDRTIISAMNIVIWGFAIIPILVLFAFIHQLLFSELPFTLIPIPIYVLTISLITGPVLSHILCSHETTQQIMAEEVPEMPSSNLSYVQGVYLITVTCCILFSIGVCMVCGKLDGFFLTKARWVLVLIPIEGAMLIVSTSLVFSPLLASLLKSEGMDNCLKNTTMCSALQIPSISLPCLIGIVLTSLKLDGIVVLSYSFCLLPILFSAMSVAVMTVVCGCGCFGFKLLRYSEAVEDK